MTRGIHVAGATVVAVAVLSGVAWATTHVTTNQQPALAKHASAADCYGLACAQPGDSNYVPQASAPPVATVAGPGALKNKTKAGFYAINNQDPSSAEPNVAYVIPPSQADSAPASVQELPVVAESSPAALASTQVIFEPNVAAVNSRNADKRFLKAHGVTRKRANSDCDSDAFCLFECHDGNNGVGCYNWLRLTSNKLTESEGWKNLSIWEWGNKAKSMVNNRNFDMKLAGLRDGNGAQYCADSNSSDGTFANNPIGDANANSAKATGADNIC
jgi:hypothetical protein